MLYSLFTGLRLRAVVLALAVGALHAPGFAHLSEEDAWLQYRGNGAKTGYARWPEASPPGGPTGSVLWQLRIGDRAMIDASPVVAADGTIYVGANRQHKGLITTRRPTLLAISPDGTIKWELIFPRGGFGWYALRATPAIRKDGALVVVGQFYESVQRPDGTTRWDGKQRLFLVSPEGKILASTEEFKGEGLVSVTLDREGNAYYWEAEHLGLARFDTSLTMTMLAGLKMTVVGTSGLDWCEDIGACFDTGGVPGPEPAGPPVWPVQPSAAFSQQCNDLVASVPAWWSVHTVLRARPFPQKLWEREIGGWSHTPAVGTAGRTYFATSKERLEAWNQDRRRQWRVDLKGVPTAPPAVGRGRPAPQGESVECVSKDATGNVRHIRDHRPDDTLYVPVWHWKPLRQMALHAFDWKGRERWTSLIQPLPQGTYFRTGVPAVIGLRDGQELVLVPHKEGLWAIAGENGALVWTVKLDSPAYGSPAVAHGRIYVATQTSIYAIGP